MRIFHPDTMMKLFAAGVLACGTISASTLYYAGSFVYDSNPNANNGGFNNNTGSSSASDTFTLPSNVADSPSDPGGTESVVTSANLAAGALHAQSSGNILITQTPGTTTSFFTGAESFLGDTFTIQGTGLAGGHLYADLTVDGSFSYFQPNPGSSYTNGSFFEIYVDPVGSFDGPYTPYAAYFYGIGSDYGGGSPPNATYMGTVEPGTSVPVTIPFNLLHGATQFQVAVGLGTFIYGNGAPGFSWNANFGDTLNVSFSTDPNIALTSAGGFAGTQQTASAVPEPGTFGMLALAGLALTALKRRRRSAILD